MSKLTLRANPTCQPCHAENPGAYVRQVFVDGKETRCACCGWLMGDTDELTIPSGVATVFTALISRVMFRVESFHTEVGMHDRGRDVVTDSLSLYHRTNKLRINMEWFPVPADDAERKPVEVDMDAVRAHDPMLAMAVQTLMLHGFTPIECPKNLSADGVIRFRGFSHHQLKSGNQPIVHEKLMTRVQLCWFK